MAEFEQQPPPVEANGAPAVVPVTSPVVSPEATAPIPGGAMPVGGPPVHAGNSSNKNKIFVGGLAPNTSSETLREAFGVFGEVESANVMEYFDKFQQVKRSRGFGFVTFVNEESMEGAVSSQHIDIDGKPCEVKRIDENKSSTEGKNELESRKIFCGGLADTVDSEKLKTFFVSTLDPDCVEAKVMIDPTSGRSRCFGYVTFSSKEMVDRAVANSASNYIDGKWVDVKPSTVSAFKGQNGKGGKDKGFYGKGYDDGKGGKGGFGKGGYGKGKGKGWDNSSSHNSFDSNHNTASVQYAYVLDPSTNQYVLTATTSSNTDNNLSSRDQHQNPHNPHAAAAAHQHQMAYQQPVPAMYGHPAAPQPTAVYTTIDPTTGQHIQQYAYAAPQVPAYGAAPQAAAAYPGYPAATAAPGQTAGAVDAYGQQQQQVAYAQAVAQQYGAAAPAYGAAAGTAAAGGDPYNRGYAATRGSPY